MSVENPNISRRKSNGEGTLIAPPRKQCSAILLSMVSFVLYNALHPTTLSCKWSAIQLSNITVTSWYCCVAGKIYHKGFPTIFHFLHQIKYDYSVFMRYQWIFIAPNPRMPIIFFSPLLHIRQYISRHQSSKIKNQGKKRCFSIFFMCVCVTLHLLQMRAL